MKYCKFDGFTYPDSVINCRACGGSLLDIPSNQDSPDQLASSVSASECPNPECEITFARTDQTRFCPGCGIHLEPTSVNLVDVYGTPQGVPERAYLTLLQAAELIEKPKWRGRSRKKRRTGSGAGHRTRGGKQCQCCYGQEHHRANRGRKCRPAHTAG